ncbi:MAG: heavy metal-binding domain-containing protein, partial [Thermoanaerobaculia bacterium]
MLACRKKSETAESPSASHPTPGREVLYWYDPMKPEVHFDKPGKSPFMDMELVPKYAEETPAPAASGQKKVLYWYDPMKPEVHFDKPGKS